MHFGFRTGQNVRTIIFATLHPVIAVLAHAESFELTSPDLGPDRQFTEKFLFSGMGCNGANLSPALTWSEPPTGTKSFALMVHDPDAMTGGAGIWHWVVVDIPAANRTIVQAAGTPEGTLLPPGSRQVRTDYGRLGWGGPCPPRGHKPHAYNFTLYALNVEKLEIPPDSTASHAGFVINRASVGRAVFTATYGR